MARTTGSKAMRLQGLPGLGSPPAIAYGPAVFAQRRDPQRLGVPGEAPAAFLTQRTTQTEWIIYWALARVTGEPPAERVRQGPFIGGPPIWTYQAYVDAGADRATNVDFVVWAPGGRGHPVAIRIQTEFVHNFASNDTQVYDIIHRERLERGMEVVDIYDQDYMRDDTGAAAIVLVKEAMGLIERKNVHTSGRAQRV